MIHRLVEDTAWHRIRHMAVHFLLSGFILLMYFSIGRPARIALTRQISGQLKTLQHPNDHYAATLKDGSLLISYAYQDTYKKLEYRPQFGFFFLISLIGLLFITTQPICYLTLIEIHLAASILAYGSLLIGASGYPVGFLLTDIIDAYLIPAISLLVVFLALDNHQSHPKEIAG